MANNRVWRVFARGACLVSLFFGSFLVGVSLLLIVLGFWTCVRYMARRGCDLLIAWPNLSLPRAGRAEKNDARHSYLPTYEYIPRYVNAYSVHVVGRSKVAASSFSFDGDAERKHCFAV